MEAPTAAGRDALFVGREPELRAFGERFDHALAGTGGLVLVAGEAGIGKTRLLDEFALAARERGALTLWGSSFEGDWHPPYGPGPRCSATPCGRSAPPTSARPWEPGRPCSPGSCPS